ncbi:DUF5302 domain-containing protein [Tsukamurella soli]|uniref:DUF5302 domain-containing protein n=1 Tax=Tsukamurella soli TaxID=644556 RepID=A0ABP8J9L0_9ACTN
MPSDEEKRLLREALERKKAQNSSGAAHLDGRGKGQRPHGSASHQQQFRRKSG